MYLNGSTSLSLTGTLSITHAVSAKAKGSVNAYIGTAGSSYIKTHITKKQNVRAKVISCISKRMSAQIIRVGIVGGGGGSIGFRASAYVFCKWFSVHGHGHPRFGPAAHI